MASTNPQTIVLKGFGVQEERPAEEAITPGHMVEFNDVAGVLNLRKQLTGAVKVLAMFAVEDELQGNGVLVDYVIGGQVLARVMSPGDEVWGFLANGQNVTHGAVLESAGAGEFTALSSGIALAIAMETLDLSASAAGDQVEERRIKLKIL